MIEVKNLQKSFFVRDGQGKQQSVQVLGSISLHLPASSIVSIVGQTGCGKSTFLEILAGLQSFDHGTVAIGGHPVGNGNSHGLLHHAANRLLINTPRTAAMVFQDYAIFPWMTSLENIRYVLRLKGFPKAERTVVAVDWLRRVGLESALHKYPPQLSGGMKQRLAIARAFAVAPRVIFLDEPFASVDELTREQLQDLLLEMWTSTGATIVLVTHNIAEAVFLSDQILVFGGRPTTIKQTIRIGLARPRMRNSKPALDFRESIARIMKSE